MTATEDGSDMSATIVELYSENVTSNTGDNTNDQANKQALLIQDLRAMTRTLHAAYVSSRVELKIAIDEASIHERRSISQQESIDDLQLKLKKLSNELSAASGSAGMIWASVLIFACKLLPHM